MASRIANFFDLCVISRPLPRAGGMPMGLIQIVRNWQDRELFHKAAAVERLIAA